jgi:HlyD family secretion protein
MKNRTRWLMAGGGVLLAALLGWAFAPRPLPVEIATVARLDFERTVDEEGRTQVMDRFVVAAPLAGRLARIAWREGDVVAAGAVLALIGPTPAPLLDERTQAELQGRVQAADAAAARADAALAGAQVRLRQAEDERSRSETLARQGFVADAVRDAAALAAQAAAREVEAAAQTREIARHEQTTARAARAAARDPAPGRDFAVRAPVAGTVLRVLTPSASPVAPGTPLLEMGDTARLEVVVELLTSEALTLGPGTEARIDEWGGAQPLQAQLRRIEPSAVTKVSALGVEEQRVRALLDLTSPRDQWRALGDGFRVRVRLVAAQEAQVLTVPVSAVFPRTDGKPGMAVFVVEGGRARWRAVTLGGRNADVAWIREGLRTGETVIVYPPAAVANGIRVEPREVQRAHRAQAQPAPHG